MAFTQNQFGNTNIYGYYATGAGNISESLSVVNNDNVFQLLEIRIHLSAAGGANDLTATLDSAAGSAYDTVILTQDMTSVVDLQETYEYEKRMFRNGDQIDFAWTNGSSRTWGLEVIVKAL